MADYTQEFKGLYKFEDKRSTRSVFGKVGGTCRARKTSIPPPRPNDKRCVGQKIPTP